MTMMRKSTFTICWNTGMMMTRPGPFTRQNRPSMNTTPRSYSRSTRNALASNASTSAATMRNTSEMPITPPRSVDRLHPQEQSFDGGHPHSLPLLQRPAGIGSPDFAMHADRTAGGKILQHGADAAYHLFPAAHYRPPPRLDSKPDHADEKQRAHERESRDHRNGNAVARRLGLEQHHRADDEGRETTNAERAEARQQCLADHEGDTDDDEAETGVIDGQHLKGKPRQQQADGAAHPRQHHAGACELVDQTIAAHQHPHI